MPSLHPSLSRPWPSARRPEADDVRVAPALVARGERIEVADSLELRAVQQLVNDEAWGFQRGKQRHRIGPGGAGRSREVYVNSSTRAVAGMPRCSPGSAPPIMEPPMAAASGSFVRASDADVVLAPRPAPAIVPLAARRCGVPQT